jgi:hypothetical protein
MAKTTFYKIKTREKKQEFTSRFGLPGFLGKGLF